MTLERRYTHHLTHLGLDNHSPKSVCDHVNEITREHDFRILTTLAWVRLPVSRVLPEHNRLIEVDGRSGRPDHKAINPHSPDLGFLPLHRDRLVAAAEAIGWRHIEDLNKSEQGLALLRSKIQLHIDGLPSHENKDIESRKVRILLSKNGSIEVDSMRIVTLSSPEKYQETFIPTTLDRTDSASTICEVFLDTQSTRTSIFTTHKTSHRPHYNAARARAQIVQAAPTVQEVLLYNNNNQIMEGSVSSVYFHRDGKWITPAAICGCTLGVTRRIALEKGLCKQGLIEVGELVDGELIWLSNGARGFFVGRISMRIPYTFSTVMDRDPL